MVTAQPVPLMIDLADARLEGDLTLPGEAPGLVIFAHGSGSSRLSPRNRRVAHTLNEHGLGTLLFDLLTEEEDTDYATRFDIELLTRRLAAVVHWIRAERFGHRAIGLFGSSTGSAAALRAAATLGPIVHAVVSRGGRPDLAGEALPAVYAPTLLIVGGSDYGVIELNRQAYAALRCEKRLAIVPGATHLFEEPGALDEVARLAGEWFLTWLKRGELEQAGAAP